MVIHENQMEDGSHTYLLNTEQHLGFKKNTQYENDDRGQHSWNNAHTKTWTLDEHQGEKENQNELNQTELYQNGLYQTNNINMVKITLTWWRFVHHMKYSD